MGMDKIKVYQFTVKLEDQDERYKEVIVVSKSIKGALKKITSVYPESDIIGMMKFEDEVLHDLW
jgi:hypothetical protein